MQEVKDNTVKSLHKILKLLIHILKMKLRKHDFKKKIFCLLKFQVGKSKGYMEIFS